jgi:hypothetical protein
MIVDDCLFAIIIAGIGLVVTYLRAEFALRRRIKAAARGDDLSLRELRANRLKHKQIEVPVAALRNHQHFLSEESAICVDLSADRMASYRIFERDRELA